MATPTLTERYQQTHSELQKMLTMLTRIDERVDIFIDKQKELEKKLADHVEKCPIKCAFADMQSKLAVLEQVTSKKNGEWSKEDHQAYSKAIDDKLSDVQERLRKIELVQNELKLKTQSQEGNWKGVRTFAFQVILNIIWVTIAAIILWYFGISAPDVP